MGGRRAAAAAAGPAGPLSTTVETLTRTLPVACGNAVDDWFLRRHLPAPDAYVVDVGCGTGEFAARLADLVPQGQVIGVEPDGPMLALARTRQRPNLRFVASCAEHLHLAVPPVSADLVVSRAARDEVPLAGSPRCLASAHTVLLTHAAGAYLTGASDEVARGFRQAVSRSVDELANPDGSYDQTLVRLDVLARRPRVAASIWT